MKQIIVFGGPTASGKTALAIKSALFLDTEIISADSRQCYTEMTIGTAKPDAAELNQVKHHFINSHHLPEVVNAGVFAAYAAPVVQDLLQKNGSVVIAGGTGLYIKALLGGLDDFPEVSPEIREQLNREWNEDDGESLRQELERTDPDWYSRTDLQNPRRVMRALEIIRVSGKPYSSFLGKPARKWDAEIRFFYPDPERQQLYKRIAERVRKMIEDGLEKEVRSLLPWREHPALHSVGYREFFEYFDGKTSLEHTVENIIRHTRNYAKRQWTWFRNQGDWTPVNPEKWEPSEALANQR